MFGALLKSSGILKYFVSFLDPSGKTWPRSYNAYSYTSPSSGERQHIGMAPPVKDEFTAVLPKGLHSNPIAIHNVSSPINVSAGGSAGFRGRPNNGGKKPSPGQALHGKHLDF